MRSYIRLDPRFAERKGSYSDGAYAALIDVFCYAEQQADRGRFKSEAVLKAFLGRRARHIPYLIERGDLVEQPDGRLYVDGWDEWQEGDWQVAERMRRVRERKRGDGGDRNAGDGGDRNGALARRGRGGRRQAVGGKAPDGSDTTAAAHARAPSAEAAELLKAYKQLGYEPSFTDAGKAMDFVAELGNRLTVDQMAERMSAHLSWCELHQLPAPATLGGFWSTLRTEADRIADTQPPKRSDGGGMSSVASLLGGDS
ncbi:MAG TPA: hypothetical protein VF821_09415 [Lentzea sp.]